jgi:hypothetical protein
MAAACVLGASAAAQSQPALVPGEKTNAMLTDRPGFTESSDVIARGTFQFESGLNFEVNTRNGLRQHSTTAPTSLMRFGLGGRTELRLGSDGFLSRSADGARASGYSDLEVGLKIRLLDHDKAGVDVAVIPMISVPTGSEGFTSGHIDPTIKLTWARALAAGFGATGNVNLALSTDDDGRYTQRAFSVSLGRDLLADWGGFVEAYGFTPVGRGDGEGVPLDWGVSRLVGHNLQFDAEMGRALVTAAPDWFVGFGFAIRGSRLARK